ncbi:MAG: hypothetical protein KF901_14405 [Myxococcales bacterium]|nr:hypothetical protein [Myxococcales bacterium]
MTRARTGPARGRRPRAGRPSGGGARIVAAAALSVLTLLPLAARGQRPQPAATDESTAHFERGVEHLRAERYREAVDAFRASYRIAPRVTTMCNLALSYDRWGPEHRENAARAYRTCATEDETGRFADFARERVAAIERELVLEEPTDESTGTATDASASTLADATGPTDGVDASERATDPLSRLPAPSEPHAARPRPLAWVSLASAVLGAAAFATGVALALEARATRDRLGEEVGAGGLVVRGTDADRLLGRGESFARGARAAYAISGIAAAAAGVFLALDLVLVERGADARVRLSPGLGGATLHLDLRF